MRFRLSRIWLVILLLEGCASSSVQQTPSIPQTHDKYGFIKRATFGIELKTLPNGESEIWFIYKEGPADKAGIKVGDVLESIDGRDIRQKCDYLDFLSGDGAKQIVTVGLMRNGETVSVNVSPNIAETAQDYFQIRRLLWQEKTVRLAIMCGEINNLPLEEPLALEQWKRGTRSSILAEYETVSLDYFRSEKNFVLVDRSRISEVANELSLQSSGLVSQAFVSKLGELLGATHLWVIDVTRYRIDGKLEDSFSRRLIEVETGRVIAVVRLKVYR
jgi:membrane-associated protease RseP (regulator of RpoE activity)